MSKNETRNIITRTLRAQQALKESAPIHVLTPESDATRQLQQDVAASSNKGGIPRPVSGNPSEATAAAMGTITEPPAHNLDAYAQAPEKDGVHLPPDQKGGYSPVPGTPSQNPPANDLQSLGPETDPSRQLQQDVALAKNKSGIPRMEDLEKMSDADLVEAFVAAKGGVDGAIFALVADGSTLGLAESIVKGEVIGEPFVRERLMEIFGFGKKTPSEGKERHRADIARRKAAASGKMQVKFDSKREQPYSATRSDAHDARKNR
jgi:hypothetical protein